jgi:endonuclease-3
MIGWAEESRYDTAALSETARKTRKIDQILEEVYGRAGPADDHTDPLVSLVRTILSQNTSDQNAGRAFAALEKRFPAASPKGGIDWEAVASAPTEAVADAIRSGGLANQKSERIQGILDWIRSEYGDYTLWPVCRMAPEAALALLTRQKGIGVKTAAVVLAFSCGMDLFPVDTHVHRVCRRLGLVGEKASAEKTFQIMQDRVDEGRSFALHIHMIRLGREVCRPRNPRCRECPLNGVCDYAGA